MISFRWLPFNPRSLRTVAFQFVANIKRLKEAIKDWSVAKRLHEDRELKQVEEDLSNILKGDGGVC